MDPRATARGQRRGAIRLPRRTARHVSRGATSGVVRQVWAATLDEADPNGKSAAYAEYEVGGVAAFQKAVPGYHVETFAYPYGESVNLPSTTWRGVQRGQAYHLQAALLVGAGPAPSPYSKVWQPLALPRIRW